MAKCNTLKTNKKKTTKKNKKRANKLTENVGNKTKTTNHDKNSGCWVLTICVSLTQCKCMSVISSRVLKYAKNQ